MDAVIPAAGRGSRLGELTADRPKGLVEVAGRPLLAHVFDTAVDTVVDELPGVACI
ncbi:NTP transferase domain-containing protein [Halorubrum distributum]|nr:NTP transferase domain-containing protein [Halorubrum distributum]MDV7349652.1 NTP transferase domain-containing protein [Halorubrum distributum]